MKKIILALFVTIFSTNVFADTMMGGHKMSKVLMTIKEQLGAPKKISDNISLTNLYDKDEKYVVYEYTYNYPIYKDKVEEAKKSTELNMIQGFCDDKEVYKIMYGDNLKNVVVAKHIYKGEMMFEIVIPENKIKCKK